MTQYLVYLSKDSTRTPLLIVSGHTPEVARTEASRILGMSHPEGIAGFQAMLRDAYLEPMPVAYAPKADVEAIENGGGGRRSQKTN